MKHVEVFFALSDVRDKLARWRDDYNQVRPHSALRDATPAAFARSWQETQSAAGPRVAGRSGVRYQQKRYRSLSSGGSRDYRL